MKKVNVKVFEVGAKYPMFEACIFEKSLEALRKLLNQYSQEGKLVSEKFIN